MMISTLNLSDYSHYHAISIHFPIILLTLALLGDLLNYFGVKRALIFSHYLVILGLISCIPALFTGQIAANALNPNDELVLHHEKLAIMGAIFTSLYVGLRISIMYWKIPFSPIYYLVLSLLLVLLFSWIKTSGEEILPVESHHAVTK